MDPKRRRFVEELRVDWNATQAAIRAGYSPKSAQRHASDLLTKQDIQEALAEVMAEDASRCQVKVDDAIAELTKVAFLNIMDYMRISPDGDPYVDLSALTRDQALGLGALSRLPPDHCRGPRAGGGWIPDPIGRGHLRGYLEQPFS